MSIDFTDRDSVKEAISLVDEMTDAELNKFVDYIRFTMKDRARRRNAKAKASFEVGDRVRLAGQYKPQYLTGLTGQITDIRQTRVAVKLDCGPVGKFRTGIVLASPSGLEVLSTPKGQS